MVTCYEIEIDSSDDIDNNTSVSKCHFFRFNFFRQL